MSNPFFIFLFFFISFFFGDGGMPMDNGRAPEGAGPMSLVVRKLRSFGEKEKT
jgi:hypothetical protein